ncbi:MAG: pyridoxamine 5'-phosphate oxidase family protein, partial [Chromatiales bacterium]|nr:pyridoxamine 5'-phosphate oxidase family protein [Chromatiales bacterium]
MKKIFKITDKNLISEMLNSAEYGVLALCGKKPYAVPVNFVYLDGSIYFHGSPKGKKMRLLKENNNVSFNVTTDSTIIPSYFSSTEELACPASAFFRSIIIDGKAEIIAHRE